MIISPQVQDLVFPFVQCSKTSLSLILQSVQFPVNGSTTSSCTCHSSQFGIICELAEGTLCHSIQVINEEIKQYWPSYQPLWYTTSDSPPTGLFSTDHNPLGLTVQPVFKPPHYALI